jgi:hypothetical protein
MISNMCTRCLEYGVQIAQQRARKFGSFPAKAAMSATLPAHEVTLLLSCAISNSRSFNTAKTASLSNLAVWHGVHTAFQVSFLRPLMHANEASY